MYKVGDPVKIVRKPQPHEPFAQTWVPSMDLNVGKVGVVGSVDQHVGYNCHSVMVLFDGEKYGYSYPDYCISYVIVATPHNNCSCTIQNLMIRGCRCGSLSKVPAGKP